MLAPPITVAQFPNNDTFLIYFVYSALLLQADIMSHMSATTHRKENSFWLQGLNGESSVLTAPQTGFVSPLSLLALGNLPERTVTSALSSTAM